jgi:large conductance mechanosensitive channel
MSLIKEFKDFINRGSVIDLAVAVIIGASFGKIVSSLVNDILMPPIGVVLGGVDFSDLTLTLKNAAQNQPPVAIKYGVFINNIIDFAIVAFCIFLVIKAINTFKGEQPKTTKVCPECQMEIPINAKRCGHCTSEVRSD